MNKFDIDILIPTYNRSGCLEKNLRLLNEQVSILTGSVNIQVIISDNHSQDATIPTVNALIKEMPLSIILLTSEENVGLEANTVKVLAASHAEFVMFLGDDDYLPDGYLQYAVDMINEKKIGCLIPGFSALFNDGKVIDARGGHKHIVAPSFKSVLMLSLYGHQLSGLLFRRSGVLDAYLKHPQFRNIYLFIYFVTYSLSREISIFNPEFQVLVSQGNSKDWKYDDSGLLTQMFCNYEALFGAGSFRSVLCCLRIIYVQPSRMRFSIIPLKSVKAVAHILRSKNISTSVKMAVFIAYPLFYMRGIVHSLKSFIYSKK